jgi:hypothetical protein
MDRCRDGCNVDVDDWLMNYPRGKSCNALAFAHSRNNTDASVRFRDAGNILVPQA